jgi:hypothetical protein
MPDEDALARLDDWVDGRIEEGYSLDEIMSALELKLMALKDEARRHKAEDD